MMNDLSKARPKLLIVEDDDLTVQSLRLGISKHFELLIAKSSTEFHEIIASRKFDAVLMDIALREELNGLDLTRELKHSGEFKDIPVIVLTAHVQQRDERASYEAGVDLFLKKPISYEQMSKAILELMEKSSAVI